jgi:hypothetical protein
MPVFVKRTRIAAPADAVFAWHERPDALERLTPPWARVQVVSREGRGLAVGTRVVLRMKVGPIWRPWVAVHTAYEPGRSFTDVQERGPFARWVHTHRMEPIDAAACDLVDEVEYALPFGRPAELLAGWFARRQLERLFAYRHQVTRAAVEAEQARRRS